MLGTGQFSFHLLTFKASLSIEVVIFAQNSSQQMFSSAVTTSAEQQANTLYSLDHVDSIDFWAAWTKYRDQNRAVLSGQYKTGFWTDWTAFRENSGYDDGHVSKIKS